MLHKSLRMIRKVASNQGRILFVGTKPQSREIVSAHAKRCGQYYVNHRWLGGMLTNWNTVSASIKTLEGYEKLLADEEVSFTKKERLTIERKKDKLELSLGGIRNMGERPDLVFVLDTNDESIAVLEANNLSIPVVAVLDTNSIVEGVDYPIPGNDDARKSIELYMRLAADAVLLGIEDNFLEMQKQAEEKKEKSSTVKKVQDAAEKATKKGEKAVKEKNTPVATKAVATKATSKKDDAKKAAETSAKSKEVADKTKASDVAKKEDKKIAAKAVKSTSTKKDDAVASDKEKKDTAKAKAPAPAKKAAAKKTEAVKADKAK